MTPARDWRRHVRDRLPPLEIAPERQIEIVDELALQLEAAFEAARADGATLAEAEAAAAREVPDWEALAAVLSRIERAPSRRATADIPTGGLMNGCRQDIQYAWRTLRRSPAFSVLAATTLALAIGATTVVYSLVDGILLQPLPIADPERVVLTREIADGVEFSLSWPNFVDIQARSRSFASLGAWSGLSANLTSVTPPRRILVRQVTWNLLDVLGVRPVVGRGFAPADDAPGAPLVCLVSYRFWQDDLAGGRLDAGPTIALDDRLYTVVGVLPRDFAIARQEDVYRPLGGFLAPGSTLLMRGNHQGIVGIGRLADGVTLEAARAELQAIGSQLEREYPATNSGQSVIARPLLDVLVSSARPMLLVLLGATLTTLLIGCVNIASLMLARGAGRAQELAVRGALGAGAWRILRQLFTESALLGIGGGVAGALLAWFALGAVVALLPGDTPRLHLVRIDLRVLAVTAAVSMACAILFGLLPALQATGVRHRSLLRGARVTSAAAVHGRTRQALLVAEIALALVLVAGAALMAQTMRNLLSIEPGFDPDSVISAQLSLPSARYPADRRRVFYDAALERVSVLPGVVSAAFTNSVPVQGSSWNSVFIVADQPVPARAQLPSVALTTVTPGYHATMRVALKEGRLLASSDAATAPMVAVVNERFAQRFWPDGSAVGRRFKVGWPEDAAPWREIVGVVADVKTSGLDEPVALQAYLPLAQSPSLSIALMVRLDPDRPAPLRAVEAAVHAVDPGLALYDVRTLGDVIIRDVSGQRLTTVFLFGFAGLTVALAAIGVFGVTAYGVSQRAHEVGVRMALGASAPSVVRLMMRHAMTAALVGVVAGLAGARALSTVMESLLYGVTPRDPITLGLAAVGLVALALASAFLPARRATRINPVRALRME